MRKEKGRVARANVQRLCHKSAASLQATKQRDKINGVVNAVASEYLYSMTTTELEPLNGGFRGTQIGIHTAAQVKIAKIININNTLNIHILLIALNRGALQLIAFHTAAKIISIPYPKLYAQDESRSRSVRF